METRFTHTLRKLSPELNSNAYPSSELYTVSSLIKGSISLDEVRTLLLNWRPDELVIDFAHRVQSQGILTKATATRLQDLVLIVFKTWFLKPDQRPAEQLQQLFQHTNDRQILNELLFLYRARGEPALKDFMLEQFWPTYEEGALYLRPQEVQDFLNHAQESGRSKKPWSKNTIERTAQGMMAALLAAGLLVEEKRYQYAFARFRPSDFSLAYLAYDLHLSGVSDAALVEHPDFQLFGLNRERTLERLSALPEQYGLIVQQAGSVVRITWLYNTMDEVIHACFGNPADG